MSTKQSKTCVTCSSSHNTTRRECSKCYTKKRKEEALKANMKYCTHCGKNHELHEMMTPNGQARAKCIKSAKSRNSTDEMYNLFPKIGKEFANQREADSYLEEAEFARGFQLHIDTQYKNEGKPDTTQTVLVSVYYYCACKERPKGKIFYFLFMQYVHKQLQSLFNSQRRGRRAKIRERVGRCTKRRDTSALQSLSAILRPIHVRAICHQMQQEGDWRLLRSCFNQLWVSQKIQGDNFHGRPTKTNKDDCVYHRRAQREVRCSCFFGGDPTVAPSTIARVDYQEAWRWLTCACHTRHHWWSVFTCPKWMPNPIRHRTGFKIQTNRFNSSQSFIFGKGAASSGQKRVEGSGSNCGGTEARRIVSLLQFWQMCVSGTNK